MPSKRAMETSPFSAMDVLERASEREGVVHMEVGEPDIEPPAAATEAAIASLREGNLDYTSSRGKPELRNSIADYYDRTYGVDVSPDRIIVTPGSSPALLVTMLTTVNPGEEVVLTDPYYAPYPNFVRQADGRVSTVALDPGRDFEPRVEDFDAQVTEETAAMMLNSPANPTGAVMAGDTIEELVHLAARTGTRVISDEIYHGLAYDAPEHSVLEYTDEAFVLDGVSKRYGMTGWRLGWVVAPPDEVEAFNRLVQNVLICAPNFVQDGARAAIETEPSWLDDARETYRERRDLLLDAARRWGIDMGYTPAGAYYLLLDVSDLPGDAFEVADVFLEEANVAMTPGPDFGSMAEGTLRASYATSTADIELAIDRLDDLLSEFTAETHLSRS
ncbi:MAG: pyridoxal phosphate-dependent aminotransferase [Halobacteriota archaeon]